MDPAARRLVAARLTSQHLAGRPARSAVSVVQRVLAVQAQDGRGARLSVRSRSSGVAAADVDRALTHDRSVVVSWLNRGTLHLVTAEDYWWLHPLTTPQVATANERRLREEGVSPRQAVRGIDVVAAAVQSDGPQTRAQLRQRLEAARVPTAGQALIHVLMAATLRGLLLRGPMVGREQAFASVEGWLGPPPPALDPHAALALLAHRYLEGHGPAGPRDLAQWAGLTLGDARQAIAAIAGDVEPLGDEVVALAGAPRPSALPPPRLLGPFDPLLHGWASRTPIVGTHAGVITTNGVFRPVALVDGRVVATWGLRAGVVTIHPLEAVAPPVLDALVADAARVLRFLGLPDRPPVVA
jgi:hypothetical protein